MISLYQIDIMTLFPESVENVLNESIIGRAQRHNYIKITTHQIRDFTLNRQKQVDDYPYGGGRGAIIQADPLYQCWQHICNIYGCEPHTIFLSPCGKIFSQEDAKRLATDYDHIILVCGHYEGIDQRFIDGFVDEEISLGDFIMTGGEIAAMAVADAVCRLVPNVLPDPECYENESHWDGLLEYPQYTRPAAWHGMDVPSELLSGNHAAITHWRRKEQLKRTFERRHDMFNNLDLSSAEDQKILHELERDRCRISLNFPVICRQAVPEDLSTIITIVGEAQEYLSRFGVDQWPDGYPSEQNFVSEIQQGECYVLICREKIEAFFVLSSSENCYYNHITDGKWSNCEPYFSLHRCAVSEKYRGSGLSDLIIKESEKLVIARGYHWLRTDTHKKNKAMQGLLRRNSFQHRGNIQIPVTDGHDPKRLAFEKQIKISSSTH